jgi:hypothetical protein
MPQAEVAAIADGRDFPESRHRLGLLATFPGSDPGFQRGWRKVWLRHLQAFRLRASTVIRSAHSRSPCSATAISRSRPQYSMGTKRARKSYLRPLSCPGWRSRPRSTNGSLTPAKSSFSLIPEHRTYSSRRWAACLRTSPPPVLTQARLTPLSSRICIQIMSPVCDRARQRRRVRVLDVD